MHELFRKTERWDNFFINQKEENIFSESYVTQNICILTHHKNQVALFQRQWTAEEKKYHGTHTEWPEKYVVLKI